MGAHRRSRPLTDTSTGVSVHLVDQLAVIITRICPEGHLTGQFLDTMEVELQIWCDGCSVFYHGMAPEFRITTQIAERSSAPAVVRAANNFTHWTPEPEETRDLPAA
jgi:hypothetical protein